MTNKELIADLKQLSYRLERDGDSYSQRRVEDAIKALEQEPKTDSDCVSRKYLLSTANFDDIEDEAYGYVSAYDIVNAPPVNPAEPKIGHWTNGDPVCPCCGEDKFKDLDADIWADWRPKYCPNCGAKMQAGSEG